MAAANAADTSFPSAEIKSRAITAKLYLPNAEKGYYRGTRFDWSGNTYSLRTKNHEYFGQWFPKYDPNLHDAIMGPAEEFKTTEGGLGYELAKPGETFVRIGVGVVRRPDTEPFQAFKTYEIVHHGRWQVKRRSNSITFVHDLVGPNGYAYRYTKTMRLVKDQPRMLIEHSLRNTGAKRIQAQQYNHNFFVMDGQPSGPDSWVKFPFDLHPVRPFTGDVGKTKGGEIAIRANCSKARACSASSADLEKPRPTMTLEWRTVKPAQGSASAATGRWRRLFSGLFALCFVPNLTSISMSSRARS